MGSAFDPPTQVTIKVLALPGNPKELTFEEILKDFNPKTTPSSDSMKQE